MNTLLTEILACLAATAFLSLCVGWGLSSVFASSKLAKLDASWKSKLAERERRFKNDSIDLEEKMQAYGLEAKSQHERNRELTELLQTHEVNLDSARSEAIALNQKQAETQERLQRIIVDKEERIKELESMPLAAVPRPRNNKASTLSPKPGQLRNQQSTRSASEKVESQSVRKHTTVPSKFDDEQATVVIDPKDLPFDALDQTVRMNSDELQKMKEGIQNRHHQKQQQIEEESESTADLYDQTDITVAMTKDANFYKSMKRNDKLPSASRPTISAQNHIDKD